MSQEQIRDEAATLARLSAIRVPGDRLPALQAGLAATRVAVATLAKYDLSQVEPAGRFQPPAAR